MAKLHAEHLVKRYKTRTVVDDVSINVKSGEVVGLLGPNGAGKTTSFYMMVGLVRADEGKIFIDDRDITRMPVHARAQNGIGYLPQEDTVFMKQALQDNINAIHETQKHTREARVEQYLKILEVLHI